MSLALAVLLALPLSAGPRPTVLERAGRYDEAAEAFERGALRRHEDAGALKDLMWAYWNAHRFEEARATAERVLALRPRDPEALDVAREAGITAARERAPSIWTRAAQAYREERFGETVALYREVTALMPRDVLSLKDLMWAYWRLGRIEESMEVAARVLRLRPGEPEALDILFKGRLILEERMIAALYAEAARHLEADRFAQAEAIARRIIGMRPRRAYFRRFLVEILGEAGRLDEALAEARTLVGLFPRDAPSWTTLGGVKILRGDLKGARRSLEHALELDAKQHRAALRLAELLLRSREFAAAERLLKPWEESPLRAMSAAVPWLLGQALFWQGRHEEALARFADAVEARPKTLDAAYYHAWTLLKLGRWRLGRAELEGLSAKGHKASFAMLLDEAVARDDLDRALALAAPALKELDWSDEGLVLRAAGLMERAGRAEEALRLLTRFTAVLPESQAAWLVRGRLELAAGRPRKALRSARAARRVNPAAREAAFLEADAAQASGNRVGAARVTAQAREREPATPDAVLRAARAAYAAGERRAARREVASWLAGNDGPVLPALLYHGLAAAEGDPLLAYSYHHSQRTFDDHMRAIKEAGYTPVTTEDAARWLEGSAPLPDKPVLITFDDGRRDGLALADPVLERRGLKATMMAGVIFVEGERSPSPAYASWSELRAWGGTGRWELQSHGAFSHGRVPLDERGRKGLFLVGRKPGESEEARRDRIDEDHDDARRVLARELGAEPIAFAYPEGAAGHTAAPSNAPDSFALNRELAARHYRLAFAQDRSGVNTRGRDPLLLSRLEPDNKWTGDELVERLTTGSPLVAARALQLEWAARDGDFDEAYRLLSKLESMGAGASELLAKEASIRYYAGDLDDALFLARRAVGLDGSREGAGLARRIEAEDAPFAAPAFQHYRDDQGRRTWSASQRLDLGRHGSLRPRAGYRRLEAAEPGGPTVVSDAPGAGLDARLAPGHALALDAERHFLGGRGDDWAAEAGVGSRWPLGWRSRAAASRSPLYAPRPLSRGVHRRGVDLSARFEPGEPWAASVRARRDWHSDDNRRSTLEAEGSRRLAAIERLTARAVYRFVYDDARALSEDYWTPQDLTLHALGPELSYALAERVTLKGRWLAARGKESIGAPGAYHQARAALSIGWRELDSLELGFDYNRAPRYRGVGFSAQAAVRLGP